MAKRKKNRKPTIAQLKEKLANIKKRSELLLAMALGKFKAGSMTKRNRKRAKDKRNHWSKDWE